tara:strand:- start:308 stop:790 length:483 start_codon:yes stop_codon:yes gene_type:complete
MYKKKYGNSDFETHKLEVILDHEQNAKPGGWDYKSKPKVQMYDSTTKKKYSAYQFQQWLESPHILDMIRKGANLKIATQDFEDNPTQFDDGNKRKIIFYFSALKNQPFKNQDGLKPISQTMPQYSVQQMTEAQPSAPDSSKPVNLNDHQKMNQYDDDIPF